MDCLWCNEAIMEKLSWKNIILADPAKRLCSNCEAGLERLLGKRCEKCSRRSKSVLCDDCRWWNSYFIDGDPLDKNYSIFTYNKQMQEMIAKWKYRGDYILGEAFKTEFAKEFSNVHKNIKDAVVIAVPLSIERMKERGFNQAEQLATFCQKPKRNPLTRIHGEKQSKKSRRERLLARNPFKMVEMINKPVILVDDIYTTGMTLRHAAKMLKQHGCPTVYAFTLIRG